MTKVLLRDRATQLRKEGYLYGQIARTLNISKSTSYLWTKDVQLSEDTKEKVSLALGDARKRAVISMIAERSKKSTAIDKEIADEASRIVNEGELSINNRRILCSTLFWCEGQKDVSGGVKFINSDPNMMRVFLNLLRTSFVIDESKFRALLHLHEYHDERIQVEFWAGVTGIPQDRFYKSYLKPHTGKNIHVGYPGCLSLRYGDVRLAKLLKMIYSNLGNNLGV